MLLINMIIISFRSRKMSSLSLKHNVRAISLNNPLVLEGTLFAMYKMDNR